MPINRLLANSKLGPDEIKRLNAAYTYALRLLSVVDRNDPLTEMLARKIIEAGATESDPAQISKIAIKRLNISLVTLTHREWLRIGLTITAMLAASLTQRRFVLFNANAVANHSADNG
jgi:hypothetical protein